MLGSSLPMFHASSLPRPQRLSVGGGVVALLCFLLLVVAPSTAFAQVPSPKMEVTKATVTSAIETGKPFEYILSYKCASITENCEGATLTDVLPPMLEYIPDSGTRTTHIDRVEFTPDLSGATGGTVTWVFKDPLPAGSTGILRFQAQFEPGTLPGTIAENDASMQATNDPDNPVVVWSKKTKTTALGKFEMVAEKSLANSEVVAGFPAQFSLSVCSPDSVGGVNFVPKIVFTDTLPAEARFIGAEGVQGVDWVYTPAVGPDQGGNIRFTTVPTVTVGVGVCASRAITLQFDSPVTVTNFLTVTGFPEGCTVSSVLPHCQGKTKRTLTDTLPITVIAPFPELSSDKSSTSPSSFSEFGGTEARPGETVTYTVSSVNSGYITLTNVSVVDSVPEELDLVSFSAGGSASLPVTVSYQLSNSVSWVTVAGSPFVTDAPITVASLGLGVGDVIANLRWQFSEMLPGVEFSAQVIGTVDANVVPTDDRDSFENCVDVSSDQVSTAQVCDSVTVVDKRAIPRIAKSSPPGNYYPLDIPKFTLTLTNDDVAHLPLSEPVMVDLLPAAFDYIAGSATFVVAQSDVTAPPPALEVIPNYPNTGGRTLLRWSWAETGFDLAPGQQLVVTYEAQVPDGTPPGLYDNLAALVDWSGPTDPDLDPPPDKRIYLCSGDDDKFTDELDLDGDGNTDEVSCQAIHKTRVPVALAMDSQKLGRGEVDCLTYGTLACEPGDYNKLGLTTIGGPIDYQLVMTNTSNVSVTKISLIDIFPFVGDTGVVDTSARESDWRANLQAAVSGTVGIPLTIYYSEEGNPCRSELVPEGPAGCVDPNWSSTLPSDPTSVQSIKLDFCAGGECLVLERNEVLSFTWPMVAPNDAPAHPSCSSVLDDSFSTVDNPDCQLAWNSFGFTAFEYKPADQASALKLLPTEPIKVGMRVITDTGPAVFSIGDLVWLDIAGKEKDGIQQLNERVEWGVSGVRVELYDGSGNYLGYRITGPNNLGWPGYYLFTNLVTGTYQLRFYPPAGYQVTRQNQGPDDTVDSDGWTSGVGPFGAYSQTVDFLLNNTTVNAIKRDVTRDFGLWKETDYGDAFYDDPDWRYPVRAADWITPSVAGRHIIFPGMYLGSGVDDELDGQPDLWAWRDDQTDIPDDEDGVLFEDYIGTAALPIAVMEKGDTSVSLTISGTKPITLTDGYINAWVDWNGDGDWDDSGEQMITNLVFNGGLVTPPSIAVPSGAKLGTTYARFRYSTERDLTPGETAIDGEVEDYQVQIVAELKKGLSATSEAHSTGSAVAVGEIVRYTLTVNVPEGVLTNFRITDNIPTNLRYLNDGTAKVAFVSNVGMTTTVAALDGVSGLRQVGAAPVTPVAVIPSGQISGGPFGSGTDPVFNLGTITNPDFDDDQEYVIVEINALVLNNTNNQSGSNRDNSFTATYGSFTEQSNNVRVTVREPTLQIDKRLVLPTATPVGPGAVVTYEIVVSHTVGSELNAFDVVITDTLPSEMTNWQIVSVTAGGSPLPSPGGGSIVGNLLRVPPTGGFDLARFGSVTIRISGTIASGVVPNQVIVNPARVAWTSLPITGTLGNPTGSVPPGGSGALDGERDGSGGVNDHFASDTQPITINGDWGDLPDSYKTLSASNGPRHTILFSGNPYLGDRVDSESNGQPNATATGDDTNGGPDDEDGITFLTPLMPGTSARIQVKTGTPGYLSAFIDFNADGVLDVVPVSGVVTVAGAGSGTIPGSGLIGDMRFDLAGTYELTITVPISATGVQAARFRFTQNENEGGNSRTGAAVSGEVEEYLLMSLGDRLWLDDGNGNAAKAYNGLFDTGELAVPEGVTVTLVVSGTNTPIATTTTDASGKYLFTGLNPGNYQVIVNAQNFALGSELAGYVSTLTTEPDPNTNGDNNDNGLDDPDPTVAGIRTGGITLTLGQEPTTDGDSNPNSNLTLDLGFVRLDWGDLPDPLYPSVVGNNGARHVIVPGINLGSAIDDELDGQPNATASGDDVNGIPDDEDGVSFGRLLVGQTAVVTVTVSAVGTLNAWADLDGNGTLDEGAERIFSERSLLAGQNVLTVTVPITAVETVFSRFRFTKSTGQATTPTGLASNGEVEDYVANTIQADFGDLPGPYRTLFTADGPHHEVLPGLFFGALVDTEVDGVPAVAADGDDLAGDPNDEDGVSFSGPIMPNSTVTVTLEAVVTTTSYYAAYFDFNGDGDLADAGESYTGTVAVSGPIELLVTAPGVVTDTLYSRFRLGLNASEVFKPTGYAFGGEVEDYAFLSLGDQLWLDGSGAPADAANGIFDVGETGVGAGISLTLVLSDTNVAVATTTTDADGKYLFTGLPPGNYRLIVDAANFQSDGTLEHYRSTLTVEPDPNDNGNNNNNGLAAANPAVDGVRTGGITLALGEEPTNDGNGANSNLTLDLGFVKYDWGDLPISYATQIAQNGPRHVVVDDFYLGSLADSEGDGQPNATASGDDLAGDDDEDGVLFATPLVAGTTAALTVTASSDGYLNAWVDFNGNGSFDPGEQVASDLALVSGANTITFTVPTTATGVMASRFRLSAGTGQANTPTGAAPNGEVEDYVLAAVGDFVWRDTDFDGIQDGDETGINEVVVTLLDSAGQPVLDSDGLPIITTTALDPVGGNPGWYQFAGLLPGVEYKVQFVPPVGEFLTQRDQGGDDEKDSDADRTSGITGGYTLSPAQNRTDVDAGLVVPVRVGDYVWRDLNANGRQDDGDVGVEGVVVTLTYSTGVPVLVGGLPLIDTTDADGLYLFENLDPGDYAVVFDLSTLPLGSLATIPNVGSNDKDSDGDPITGATESTGFLKSGEENLNLDLGVVTAGIVLIKYTNGEDADTPTGPFVNAGSVVTWSYVVTNSGEITLTDVTITDTVIPGEQCVYKELAPGASKTCEITGTAIVGQYANIGAVKGKPLTGLDVTDDNPSHYFGQTPAIAIIKYTKGEDADTPTGPFIQAGDPVTWTYYVTNTGNVTLTNVVVTDDQEGVNVVCPVSELAPKVDMTCVATGTATIGQYANLGSVKGTPPTGPDVTDDNPSHYFGQTPGIAIIKYTNGEDADTATGPFIKVGDPVTWTYYVTNTGNVTLTNVVVTDDQEGVNVVCPVSELAPKVDMTCVATGTATIGQYANLGSVKGTPPTGPDVTDDNPSHYFGQTPGIAIIKYTNGEDADTATGPVVAVGSTVTWTYYVSNTSNVTLTNVVVTDNQSGVEVVCPVSVLAPKVDMTCVATGTAVSGQYANIGSVTGTPPSGPNVTNTNPSHYFGSPVIVGDFVWVDANGDGLQDGSSDEPGVPDVKVSLYDAATDQPFLVGGLPYTQTTGSTGEYLFIALPRGDYYVIFDLTTLPAGYVRTLQDAGDDTLDSDADATGRTPSTGFLTQGQSNLTLDLGIYAPASLGDYVWIDTNADGQQGDPADEPGVPGVVVTIYDAATDQPVLVDGQPYTATTDADGKYLFTILVPGSYYVIFDLTTRPDDTGVTQPNIGADATDSDTDPVTGKTAPVTLVSGESNTTIDMGLLVRSLLVEANPSCIKDGPYLDYTVTPISFDPGENPVTVRWVDVDDDSVLYEFTGQPLSNMVLWPEAGVDGNGFGNLWPGWTFEDGQWVDNGSSLRPSVRIEIEVNPIDSVTVAYPPATPTCSTGPRCRLGRPRLARHEC